MQQLIAELLAALEAMIACPDYQARTLQRRAAIAVIAKARKEQEQHLTAHDIFREENTSDGYYAARNNTAKIMILASLGDWEYVCQWMNGTCLYKDPSHPGTTAIVEPNDCPRIEREQP